MYLGFEWDDRKAAANRRKHHVSFEEAATVFDDPLSISFPDPDHSENEDHWIIIGHTLQRPTLLVIYMERGRLVRIISARRATHRERMMYEEGPA